MIVPVEKSRDTISAMSFPDPTRLAATFTADRELARSARFWSGAMHFGVGERRFRLRFENGRFAGAEAGDATPGPTDLTIAAAPAEWDKLLAPVPPPFYQDPYGASIHHPVSLGGDLDTLFAYYGALRRVIEILREARA